MNVRDELERFRERDWADPDVSGAVRMALVGLGGFTVDSIAPAIERAEHVSTTVVVSGSKEKATRIADDLDAEHGLTYEEYHDGVASNAYDAVFVGTPNATHLEHVETAARNGKDVLCEKPMEATAERAERMVETCEHAGVTLMIAYRVQTNPLVRWARYLVREGVIGDPIHCRGSMSQRIFEIIGPDPDQWRLDQDLSGGAALIDLGIYPLNTARFLMDADPESVHAFQRSDGETFSGVDEHISFEASFDNDALGAFTASQNSYEQGHLHVTGTEGQIVLSPAFMGPATVRVVTDDIEERAELESTSELFQEVEYFATCVLAGREPEPNGRHGLIDMRSMDAMYRSASLGDRITL